MPTLLALDVGPRGDRSISRALGRRFVEHWQARNPGGRVLDSDSRSAELLSDTHKNLVRQLGVLYGASQHDTTDHGGSLKDGFLSSSHP
jgi:FMN-dependent NADH-azoreductase